MSFFSDIKDNAQYGYSAGYQTGSEIGSVLGDLFTPSREPQEFPVLYEQPTTVNNFGNRSDGVNLALLAVGIAVLFLVAKG